MLTSLCTVWVLSFVFQLTHEEYVTLLPKSITTAIGMGLSQDSGGYVTITVAVIILTGVLGNMFCEIICKLTGITHPVAKGIAIGTSSHAIGTARAMQLGDFCRIYLNERLTLVCLFILVVMTDDGCK